MPLQSAFTLTANEIFTTLGNMIISQEVHVDDIVRGESLVQKAKVDVGLFGDRKLYYATNALKTREWGADSEASNLLSINRPANPKVQAIVIDKFRQVDVTTDMYLSKRAWGSADAFSAFHARIVGWIYDTKNMYEDTKYNSFVGTLETSVGRQNLTATLGSGTEAQDLGKFIADLMSDMTDYSKDFNDYGYIRKYAESGIKVIWNAAFVNTIQKVKLPVIFHNEGIVAKLTEDKLNKRYFGVVITASNIATYSDATPAAGKPINSSTHAYTPGTNHANGIIRTLEEVDVTVSAVAYHLFPGDEIPAGATVGASQQFDVGSVYIEDASVICKIVVKLPPYLSSMEVATEFTNARSLTTNHYLTFGFNTLAKLDNYPYITVRKA